MQCSKCPDQYAPFGTLENTRHASPRSSVAMHTVPPFKSSVTKRIYFAPVVAFLESKRSDLGNYLLLNVATTFQC